MSVVQRRAIWSIGLFVFGGAMVVALAQPATDAYHGLQRSRCRCHGAQIALAIQEYADVYHALPPAYIADAEGKPMHSWRVLILPFMENRAHTTGSWPN
jgi:hypothetical protein